MKGGTLKAQSPFYMKQLKRNKTKISFYYMQLHVVVICSFFVVTCVRQTQKGLHARITL